MNEVLVFPAASERLPKSLLHRQSAIPPTVLKFIQGKMNLGPHLHMYLVDAGFAEATTNLRIKADNMSSMHANYLAAVEKYAFRCCVLVSTLDLQSPAARADCGSGERGLSFVLFSAC